ncbi:hypothetical protein [Ktedonospora formicarum]|uniref:Uncharacterized protein n=1 Tax=Ktedonospora formicarum TaxID=2778364 RepID=A0A8J3MZU3_9CHLR|nr:hypothetical protein [Ktedonospora formicarum]GHO51140.1 hypothetical protein KSX_93030 [Ktedonospora formicarum]
MKTDLLSITDDEIMDGLSKPDIAIVANLDTDVVPLRYYKHHLWRLDPAVLTKRVTEITSEQYGKLPSPPLNRDYWTLADQQIAEIAMQAAETLVQAKAIQYYLTLQTFAKALAIDMQNIPLYFNFIPKEEMIDGDSMSSFLKVLLELHTPEGRIAYRKITGLKNPWILTKSCPQCGQGDKRILCSKLMGDGKTITVHCKPQEFFFRNEQGNGVTRTGCDHRFSFQVPTSPEALHEFFQQENFSLHFATRELTTILKDSCYTPVGLMATDLGVVTATDGHLHKDAQQVKGYGDHLEMLTSALGLQHFVIGEKIAGSIAARLKRQRVLLPAPVLLFGYRQRTALCDPEVTTAVNKGAVLPVFDTSALKAVERGWSISEMFQRAVRLHAFSLEELYSLKGKSLASLEQSLQQHPPTGNSASCK